MPTAPRPCPGGLTSKSSPGVCCCCCCSFIRGRGKQQTLKLCWLTRIPSPGTVPRAGPAAGLGAAGQCFPLQNSHGNQPEENVIAFLNWFAAFHVPQAPSAVPLSAATIFPSFLLCGRSYFGFVQLYLNHLWPEETKQTPKYSHQASHSLQCVLRTLPSTFWTRLSSLGLPRSQMPPESPELQNYPQTDPSVPPLQRQESRMI